MTYLSSTPANVRCFVSYDYDNDAILKTFLVSQSKLPAATFAITDWSIKVASPSWREEARRRIRSSSVVIVLCGKNTDTATGVDVELQIAQEEGKPYFLLAGYKDGGNIKPKAAKSTDKLYKWTFENLETLIHGGR